MVGIVDYKDTLCPFWSLVRKEETKCLGVKCGIFNTKGFICSFRSQEAVKGVL